MKSSKVEIVSSRQNYSPKISYNTLRHFQNVNNAFARRKNLTFVLFWSPSTWVFSNGDKTNMSSFYELFAKRLSKFCKYFFFNILVWHVTCVVFLPEIECDSWVWHMVWHVDFSVTRLKINIRGKQSEINSWKMKVGC